MKTKGIIIINKDFTADWLPILKKSGINTVGLHSLYQYGGLTGHLEWLKKEETQSLIAEFEKNGITIEHQLHALDWLLPRSLFSSCPDWFRVNKEGKRTADWNCCISNKDALDYVEKSAYKLAALLAQKSHDYYIWSDDCEGALCCCDKCRKFSGADQNMIITKRVLRGLKKYDEKARLSFLAYQDSLETLSVEPDKDIFLEFAPIGRNHGKAMVGDEEENKKMRKTLEKLLAVFPAKTTQILEYYLDVSLYCRWKRNEAKALDLDEELLRMDFKYYDSLGVAGITTFAGFIDKEWREKYGINDILRYGRILNETIG